MTGKASRRQWAAVGILVFTAMMTSGIAHHSFAMFDQSKEVTLTGTVAEFHWINPHTHLILNAEPGPGVGPTMVGEWDIEGAGPGIMRVQGWSSTTVKAGDTITVVANPLRDGKKGASLFYVTFPDGKRLYNDVARPKRTASR